MEAPVHAMIQALHNTSGKVMIVTAGAGTQALAWILGVAGASRTLLDAQIPYSWTAFRDFIDRDLKRHVTPRAARLLAGNAFRRAQKLSAEPEPLVGLSCSATIITDRPKRGEHRAHITSWRRDRIVTYSLILEKGARDRDGEERLVSQVMLNALAEAFNISERIDLALREKDSLTRLATDLNQQVGSLLAGEKQYLGVYADGRVKSNQINPELLLPGSFNPLHQGHVGLAHVAETLVEKPVAFELAAVNVDKPPLEQDVILDRLAQFSGRWPLYITRTPTFQEKARLFPKTTFVVGYDTAERILAARYYNDSQRDMLAALGEIKELGCRFLVAGRKGKDGVYRPAEELNVPQGLDALFEMIPAERFRVDISSTEIRARRRRNGEEG